jgi:serine/threonine protein kinase
VEDTADELDPGDDKLLGQTLASRYQIEQRLGEGAMGAVYRARHIKVGRAFAVKVLHAHLLVDKKVVQRFEREAELAGRLHHRNVIGVVDVGDLPDGTRYMVMDFAEGRDLATVLAEAPFPPQRIIHLTHQLLEGLYHAHEQGLIHRDFKPENVIIERDNHGEEVPRIVDFGIAILREGGDSPEAPGRLTTNGLVLGTPHYMAPEQAVADPIDHRIDLFALGIIIYEMLCGHLPFDGSGAEIARANLLLDPPRIIDRVPYLEVDPLLEAFARRLMAKKRDMRPRTAKAARELLDLIRDDRATAAATLGVPLEAVRAPATTQPVLPVRPDVTGRTRETPPQAPPFESAVAVPTPAPRHEHFIDTEPSRRVAPASRRRVGIAIAAIALAAATFGTILALRPHDDEQRPKSSPPVIATVTPAPAPPPTTAPTPPTPVITTPPSVAETPAPIVTAPQSTTTATKSPHHTIAIAIATPAPTSTPAHTASTSLTVSPTAVTATPTAAPAIAQPPSPISTALDANQFATLYQSVNAELKAFEQAKGLDAAANLWNRYRMIVFSDAISSQPKRDAAAVVLRQLRTELAKLR